MKTGFPQITADFVGVRRATFFGAILATTGLGAWLLWNIFLPEGISFLEGVQLVLFVLLFQQIAGGFWLALLGFFTKLTGGDRAQISRSIAEDFTPSGAPTAIAVPVFNEDVGRVFAGIEAMWRGLQENGGAGFDVFILSDSNKPENWIAEEAAWLDLVTRLDARGRIFYRKRRVSRNGKSGNVADFCRRWGARYRYMVVLDADSVMTGRLLHRLVAMMEANPRVALIQTSPQLALGRTMFRRMQQYAAKLYAPLFAAGSNYWHLFGANYWGHNAIIRLRPFMEYCDLPELPDPERRHIFSHDTVEAALLRRAGFDVWFAYAEEGSYEEGPPNLADSLGRDRRWCLGNLQHFWFLFAPGIDFANRFHIWMGVMAYFSSVLWFLFLVVGAIDLAAKYQFSLLSALPGDVISPSGEAVQMLLLATLALLFVPKLLSLLTALPRAKNFGGVLRLTASTLIETAVWTLLAPAMMIYYTQFVILILCGLQVRWGSQNRSDDVGLGFFQSLRIFWLPPVLALAATTALWQYARHEIFLLSPILAGWFLVPVLAWFTSRPGVGDFMRRAGLFLIREELPDGSPRELAEVRAAVETASAWDFPHGGIARAVADPASNAMHLALLRNRQPHTGATGGYLRDLGEKLLAEGPESLNVRQQFALLWDAESVRALHHQVWSRPAERLHPWWRERLQGILD